MINQDNFTFYLRYLSKTTDKKAISYKEIPKYYQDFFPLPSLSQSLNILIPLSQINFSAVEEYIDSNTFDDFESLSQGINSKFQKDPDKLYASYYFIVYNIKFDQERSSSTEVNSISLDDIVKSRKGIEIDYLNLFLELAKKLSTSSKNIHIAKFHDASTNWDAFKPPKRPTFNHQSVFVDIDDFPFISNPFLGYKNKKSFKFYFLIPFYTYITTYYPEDNSLLPLFTWEKFISLAKSNLEYETSFETNPFSVIEAKNGFYEFEFSLIKTSEKLNVNLFAQEDSGWKSESSYNVKLDLLSKDLPARNFTLNSEPKRSRHRMRINFNKAGNWKAKVTAEECNEETELFTVHFHSATEKYCLLKDYIEKEKETGFVPISPLKGLTEITDGFSLIRFVVRQKNSELLIHSDKLIDDAFDIDKDNKSSCAKGIFLFELPSDVVENSDTSGDRLIEEFVFLQFPENGRWKINISFKKENSSFFSYGVNYFFEVHGAGKRDLMSSLVFPKGRKICPFEAAEVFDVKVDPPLSFVVSKELDASFRLFAPNDICLAYSSKTPGTEMWLNLISEKKTSKDDIFEREYALTFSDSGFYQAIFDKGIKSIGSQMYVVTDSEIPVVEFESSESLKKLIEGKIDVFDDIPLSVKNNVEKMMNGEDCGFEKRSKPKKSKNVQNQKEIESLKEKAFELEKEKEDLRIRLEEMEKNEKEMQIIFDENLSKLRKNIEEKNKEIADDFSAESQNDENENEIEEYERKITELKERIMLIEKQLEIDPDKQIELLNLHQKLVKEEENEAVVLTARLQKKKQKNKNKAKTESSDDSNHKDDENQTSGKKSSTCLLI